MYHPPQKDTEEILKGDGQFLEFLGGSGPWSNLLYEYWSKKDQGAFESPWL